MAALSPRAEAQSFDRACLMPNDRALVKEFLPMRVGERLGFVPRFDNMLIFLRLF